MAAATVAMLDDGRGAGAGSVAVVAADSMVDEVARRARRRRHPARAGDDGRPRRPGDRRAGQRGRRASRSTASSSSSRRRSSSPRSRGCGRWYVGVDEPDPAPHDRPRRGVARTPRGGCVTNGDADCRRRGTAAGRGAARRRAAGAHRALGRQRRCRRPGRRCRHAAHRSRRTRCAGSCGAPTSSAWHGPTSPASIEVDGDLFAADRGAARRRPTTASRRAAAHRGPRRSARARRLGVLGRPLPPPPEETRLRGWRHSLRRDADAVGHHYDVGNDFYRLVLGPAMTYSCARFVDADDRRSTRPRRPSTS